MLHRLKAVASGYGLKPDQSAYGGLANSFDVEVVILLRWLLVLDIIQPYVVGDLARARYPIAPCP